MGIARQVPSKGKFLVELTGVSQLRATKVSGGGMEHDAGTVYEGNRNTPNLVPGTFKPQEVTVAHAHAENETAHAEVSQWFQDYKAGLDLEPRTLRAIQLDRAGTTAIATKEYVGCVPKTLKDDDFDAASNEAAMFTFSVMAEDMLTL
jgi:phage tail-like protein